MVDYFAEAYLGLLSGGHIVVLKLLCRVLYYFSQGYDTMFLARALASKSLVMKPVNGHHNTYFNCFVVFSCNSLRFSYYYYYYYYNYY